MSSQSKLTVNEIFIILNNLNVSGIFLLWLIHAPNSLLNIIMEYILTTVGGYTPCVYFIYNFSPSQCKRSCVRMQERGPGYEVRRYWESLSRTQAAV